jgi:hypothetical protein
MAAGRWLSAGGLFHPFEAALQPALPLSSRIGFWIFLKCFSAILAAKIVTVSMRVDYDWACCAINLPTADRVDCV